MKIKFKIQYMFILLSICFISCEKEDDLTTTSLSTKNRLRTVSPNEVAASFTNQFQQKSTETSWLKPYFEYNDEIALINSSEKITVTPVVADLPNAYSRLFSLEIDGEIQTVVYHMFASSTSNETEFTGDIVVSSLSGQILSAFEVEANEYLGYYPVKDLEEDLNMQDVESFCDDCDDDWAWIDHLPEVVIEEPPSSGGGSHFFLAWLFSVPEIEDEGGGASPVQDSPELGGGSGQDANQNPCPPGQIKDDNGNCIEPPEEEDCPEGFEKNANGKCVTDICDEINDQLENEDFIAELNCLANNQSASCEIGFAETLDGNFPELETANDGHSVDFSSLDLADVVGLMHTHPCVTQSQSPNSYSIQMPSPTDVTKFIQLLGVTNSEGRSLQDAYLIMASCETGLYTLKYSGTFEDLRYFNASEDIYKRYFDVYDNELKAFMKYLEEEVKIDGIEVIKYEMNNDDVSVETIQLNGSGEIVNLENCN